MNTYVAFLRGINVGGNGIIRMEALRSAFEKMGFSSVRTLLNSGNVIYKTDSANRAKREKMIEKTVSAAFGIDTRVLVRSRADIENTIASFPGVFDEAEWKHNVIFLGDKINSRAILNRYELKPDIEKNSYHDGVLYWSARWDSGTRAIMYALSKKPEYKEMTVRSVNTVKKILEIMKEMD